MARDKGCYGLSRIFLHLIFTEGVFLVSGIVRCDAAAATLTDIAKDGPSPASTLPTA